MHQLHLNAFPPLFQFYFMSKSGIFKCFFRTKFRSLTNMRVLVLFWSSGLTVLLRYFWFPAKPLHYIQWVPTTSSVLSECCSNFKGVDREWLTLKKFIKTEFTLDLADGKLEIKYWFNEFPNLEYSCRFYMSECCSNYVICITSIPKAGLDLLWDLALSTYIEKSVA